MKLLRFVITAMLILTMATGCRFNDDSEESTPTTEPSSTTQPGTVQ